MTGLLHDCVGEAARSRPDARAVIGEDRSYTYAELDDFRIAWHRCFGTTDASGGTASVS